MPTSNSAKKRMRQDQKRRARSRARKSEVKTFARKFSAALAEGKKDDAETAFRDLQSKLDRAAKGSETIHRNKAARRKSRLQKKLNKLAAAKK